MAICGDLSGCWARLGSGVAELGVVRFKCGLGHPGLNVSKRAVLGTLG